MVSSSPSSSSSSSSWIRLPWLWSWSWSLFLFFLSSAKSAEGLIVSIPTSKTNTNTNPRGTIRIRTTAVSPAGAGAWTSFPHNSACSKTSRTSTRTRTTSAGVALTRTITICKAHRGDEDFIEESDNKRDALDVSDGKIPHENSSSDVSNNSESLPSTDTDTETDNNLNTGVVLLAAVAFVSFWPLLALLRISGSVNGNGGGNPIEYFDVDTYMALKGILDEDPGRSADTILELPSLSPAEQLVGAFFGPPPPPR